MAKSTGKPSLSLASAMRESNRKFEDVVIASSEPFQYRKNGELVETQSTKFVTTDGQSIVVPNSGVYRMPTSFNGGTKATIGYDIDDENEKVWIRTVDFSGLDVRTSVSHKEAFSQF